MSWINEDGPCGGMVISSRIRIARNIAQLPFTSMASKDVCQRIADMVKSSILDSNSIISRDFDYIALKI